MALLATEVSVIGHPPHSAIGRPSNTGSRSADLAAPEGCVIGGEIAIRDPEVPLQLDSIARGERHHGLQPDGSGQRDMRGRALAEGAPDFSRAV